MILRAEPSWAGCQCFRPAESCPPGPVAGEGHACGAEQAATATIFALAKRCHQGNKAPARVADALPPFSVASHCCYLAPDISPKVTFGEDPVEELEARLLGSVEGTLGKGLEM